MKKFIFLAVMAGVVYWQYPKIVSYFGVSASACGMSEANPLGSMKELIKVLRSKGFEEDEQPSRGTHKFVTRGSKDSEFSSIILLDGLDEGPVRKFRALFPTIRHIAGGRKTPVENFVQAYWKAVTGGEKPEFQPVQDGSLKVYGMAIPYSHMQADLNVGTALGFWAYDERNPYEAVELKLQ